MTAGLILKGEFEMLELVDVYEITGAVYGMAEQAEESIGCVRAEVEELEEKVSELKENIVYEIAGAVYGVVEQAEKSIECVRVEVEELEEKVSELKENIEALMDDLAPAADSPE